MKRFLKNIEDALADSALLEMGIEVQTVGELHSKVASETGVSPLKRFFQNISDTLADAALLEMGVEVQTVGELHKAILREHQPERHIANPDECQYGDNDMCFRHAA